MLSIKVAVVACHQFSRVSQRSYLLPPDQSGPCSRQPTDRPTADPDAERVLMLRALTLPALARSLSLSFSLSLSHHHVAVSSLKQVDCCMTDQHCRVSFVIYK